METVFGVIKEAMGFRRFHLRGLHATGGEWTLVSLAWNLKRMHVLAAGTEVHFAGSGRPDGPKDGSSRDKGLSGRRHATGDRQATTMPGPAEIARQGEHAEVVALIPTGS